MANIPLAQVPQAPQGAQLSNLSMDMGQDVARATQALGGAVSQTAGVIDAYDDKRAEQRFKAAQSELQLRTMDAEAKVEQHMMSKPSDAEGLLDVKNEAYAGIWDSKAFSDLRPDDLTELQAQHELIGKKGTIKWSLTADKIKISNGNASMMAHAKALHRSGDTDAAAAKIEEMVASDEFKTKAKEEIFSAGTYQDVRNMLEQEMTVEERIAFGQQLVAKNKDGSYIEFEYSTGEGDKKVPLGGLSEKARQQFFNNNESRIKKQVTQANTDMIKWAKKLAEGEVVTFDNPDILPEFKAMIETAQTTRGGAGKGSAQYGSLASDLKAYQKNILSGDAEKLPSEEDMLKFVNKLSALDEESQIELGIEVMNAYSTVLNKGKYHGWWWSDPITPVQGSLIQQVQNRTGELYELAKKQPLAGLDALDVAEGHLEIMNGIKDFYENDPTPEQEKEFISTTVPELIKEKLTPIKVQATRKYIRGDFDQGKVGTLVGETEELTEEAYNNLEAGETYIYNGKTYTKQ